MIIGLDFDNTIICYDEIFRLIGQKISFGSDITCVNKNEIRDHLHRAGQRDEWTRLQGEIYGKFIMNAIPFEGALYTIKKLASRGHTIKIISHKTRHPYIGPKYELRTKSRRWLKEKGFLEKGLIKEDNVFFTSSLQEKLELVEQSGCECFLDDLPEVIEALNPRIKRLFFNPNKQAHDIRCDSFVELTSWSEISNVLLDANF